MKIKNFTKTATRKINQLVEFAVTTVEGLDHKDVELHVRQYNGRGAIGISFETTDSSKYPKFKHLFTNLDPDSEQFAIVYIRKKTPKNRKPNAKNWEEDFIATVVHELRHLWQWRENKRSKDMEIDCERAEEIAIQKYRKIF